jgi:hypothetical protein
MSQSPEKTNHRCVNIDSNAATIPTTRSDYSLVCANANGPMKSWITYDNNVANFNYVKAAELSTASRSFAENVPVITGVSALFEEPLPLLRGVETLTGELPIQ